VFGGWWQARTADPLGV